MGKIEAQLISTEAVKPLQKKLDGLPEIKRTEPAVSQLGREKEVEAGSTRTASSTRGSVQGKRKSELEQVDR